MQVLIYAGSRFLTSDAIAVALLQYSAALAEGREAATVEIPVLEENGHESTAVFLVGPASQIVSKDFDTALPEPDHPDVVEKLEALTRSMHPTASTDRNPPAQDVDWNWES
ncbi:hypothetical protein [Microbacterium sp. HJ5]